MSGRNRLLLNDGKGGFTEDVFSNLAITPAQTKALAIGDVDFSFEALKAGITTRVKTYRKHLAPIDYLSIFGRASLPDLADEVSMPSPTHLI